LSDDRDPKVMVLEAHEEFIQHIETGGAKIRGLAAITIVVAGLLFVSYLYQLLLPYISNTILVTVNLLDRGLQATEVALAILTLLWLYVAVRDYRFTRRLSRAIAEARAIEKDVEKRISG
jgi:hypothetical protein